MSAPRELPPWATDERSAKLLLDSVVDHAIYLLDREGRVVSWNAGARAVKGYAAEEVLGRHYSMFFTPQEIEAGEPERALLGAVKGPLAFEAWRTRKGGEKFWASIVITPVRDDGRLVGFAKVTRDLTERRSHEQRRLQLARIEESLRLRDEFFEAARRSLASLVTTARVHLQSLADTVESLHADDTRAKLRLLEWGLDRLERSLDEVVGLAQGAAERFARDACSEVERVSPVQGAPRGTSAATSGR